MYTKYVIEPKPNSNGKKNTSKNDIYTECFEQWMVDQKISRVLHFYEETRKLARDFPRRLFRKIRGFQFDG